MAEGSNAAVCKTVQPPVQIWFRSHLTKQVFKSMRQYQDPGGDDDQEVETVAETTEETQVAEAPAATGTDQEELPADDVEGE